MSYMSGETLKPLLSHSQSLGVGSDPIYSSADIYFMTHWKIPSQVKLSGREFSLILVTTAVSLYLHTVHDGNMCSNVWLWLLLLVFSTQTLQLRVHKNGKWDYSSKGWNRRTKGFPSPESSPCDVSSSQVKQIYFIVMQAMYSFISSNWVPKA